MESRHTSSNDNTAAKLAQNKKIDKAVAVAETLDLTAIFVLFLKESFIQFLENTGRFFLFPLAGVGSAIRAILAWREASLDGGKKGTLVRAVVETAAALAFGVAIIGGFVAGAVFASAAPIIFTAVTAAKAVFHAGSACYYWGKSVSANDPDKKEKYSALAKGNAIGAVASTLIAAAVGLVMLAAKPIFALLGVAAGALSVGYTVFKSCFSKPNTGPRAEGYQVLPGEPTEKTNDIFQGKKNTVGISQKLGISPKQAASSEPELIPRTPSSQQTNEIIKSAPGHETHPSMLRPSM